MSGRKRAFFSNILLLLRFKCPDKHACGTISNSWPFSKIFNVPFSTQPISSCCYKLSRFFSCVCYATWQFDWSSIAWQAIKCQAPKRCQRSDQMIQTLNWNILLVEPAFGDAYFEALLTTRVGCLLVLTKSSSLR